MSGPTPAEPDPVTTAPAQETTYTVSISCDFHDADNPRMAAAMLYAWLKDGGLEEAVYSVEDETGALIGVDATKYNIKHIEEH